MDAPLHPDMAPIAFLLGTWRGEGEGEWSTSEPFRYGEELIFEHVGRPRLDYRQSSWDLDDRSPVHYERGFFRTPEPGRVGIVLAHPLGAGEVAERRGAG